jgi:putative heme-binding domain-containing protein
MRRVWVAAALPLLTACWLAPVAPAAAQGPGRVQWIWHNEGDPGKPALAGTRYFRRVFDIKGLIEPPVDEGVLDVAATGPFTVWLNGTKVGGGADPRRVFSFDVKKYTVKGANVLAVEARHDKGPAAVLARLGFTPNGQSKTSVVSGGAWRSAAAAADGWRKLDFKEAGWQPVRVLGPVGKGGPVPDLAWDDRFSVPAGFVVQTVVPPQPRAPRLDPRLPFSLINMTFDDKGRLLVSQERGPVLLCTDPDANGVMQNIRPYCEQVRGCQGMCWVGDALLLVGDGPQGTGLYRARDTKGQGRIDEVKLLHRFAAGMGEHGPHAVLHGPDGWLYVVMGNHAWADVGPRAGPPNPAALAPNSPLTRWPTGHMGPDQGRPDTTEDVLLPRMNDARGHAANILAPGGTVWRMDKAGQRMGLVAAGFRNAYDIAFSPEGELFTFDSDMEWDENLPWYRAVRVCHCPPGADFVWRTGSANTPDYYIDSLPPVCETGRGSPVGLEFYDHHAYPEKYRGAYFMGDWAIGVIFAVRLERSGASYKAKVERFCVGAPMNVTDLNVGPDGAIYFVMGGRGTEGGVYRIVYTGKGSAPSPGKSSRVERVLTQPQPLAAWSRAELARFLRDLPDDGDRITPQERLAHQVSAVAHDPAAPAARRVRALDYLRAHYPTGLAATLRTLAGDRDPLVRAHAVWLLGVTGDKGARDLLVGLLRDGDALVRRRACEALIRSGVEPPVGDLWPLLGDGDRFVRHAARLVLERIDPRRWAERVWAEKNNLAAWNGIVALGQTNRAAPYAEPLFNRLRTAPAGKGEQALLDYLRTVQLALVHAPARPASVHAIAEGCDRLFPNPSWRVNRELAILLTDFQREKQLDRPVVAKLYRVLEASAGDRQQQIHYFYCLRLLKEGWTPEEKAGLAAWYDGTKTWQGGHSFTPFLENIFRETLAAYTTPERRRLLDEGLARPLPALVLCTRLQTEAQAELVPALRGLVDRLATAKDVFRGDELRQAALGALLKSVAQHPTPESWPALVSALHSKNPIVLSESVRALRKLPAVKPKAEDPAPYRALLEATRELKGPKDRWEVAELLRQWNGQNFGAGPRQADAELKSMTRWFTQAFPKEPALPIPGLTQPAGASKYKMADLLRVLDRAAAEHKGDVARGRLVFTKASCVKCHKHGSEGEGIGPDLTSLAKRFKRADILESILEPSKVISDQYRAKTVTTTSGQQLNGLVAVEGDTVTVTLNDASKVVLKRDEVESQVASLVSVMPEQLLDPLSEQEIIDLFAYLEEEPKQGAPPAAPGG